MNKETTIFIDTENMEERYAEGLYMDYLEEQNKKLQNNWNELKEWLEEDIGKQEEIPFFNVYEILDKMQEIEGGVDND